MSQCKCYINHGSGDVEEIVQCPLCKAAPDLLAALKSLYIQEDWDGEDVHPDSPIGKAKKAIAKAEKS